MAARTNFPGLKQLGDTFERISLVVNQILLGKMNNTLAVTLTANSTTTVITDPRINTTSYFVFDARTATAQLAKYGLYASSVGNGTATLTHANTADTNKDFIIGIFS
jgi:hypothetical protein